MIDVTGRNYGTYEAVCQDCGGVYYYSNRRGFRCPDCRLIANNLASSRSKARSRKVQADLKKSLPTIEELMRRCIACGEIKEINEFQVHSNKTGNRRSVCRLCTSKRTNEWRRKKFNVTNTQRPAHEIDQYIRGPMPGEGEKSIYILRRAEDGLVFYVGSSKSPRNRLMRHHKDFGLKTQMAVIMNVPYDDVVYWESKFVADYLDFGCPLVNGYAPALRSDNS